MRWLPWGEAAFARAKAENKPLYVYVGAFTSELGRAMRQQSFANAEIAAQLNDNFVCVVVDRDEHAGVAASLAQYVQVTKHVTGWPVNVWLTPELKPFEGATYLPPSEEWGREGITNVIKRVIAAWSADPAEVRTRAEQALADFAAGGDEGIPAATATPTKEKVEAAFAARRTAADPQHGGVGEPPRALEPELWLEQLARGGADRALALSALRSLVASPVRDPLDGGFCRASSDAAWRRPVWAKTAADQARMGLVLMVAAAEDPAFREAGRAALRFAIEELTATDGGFVTSADALDEANALALTWTDAEIRAGADEASAAQFVAALGANAAGNIPEADDASGKLRGRNLLSLVPADGAKWKPALQKLRTTRATKLRWERDTNQRAGVNGLMLGVLARAASSWDDAELKAAASRLANAQLEALSAGKVRPRLRGALAPCSATDLAALAWGLSEWARVAKSDAAEKAAVSLWSELAQAQLDAKRGVFLADAHPLAEGWKTAPELSALVGDLPAVEWFVAAAQGDVAPGEVRALARRRCGAALDDLGGSPPADVLAAAALFAR